MPTRLGFPLAWLLCAVLAVAAPAGAFAQVASPHAIDIPKWFSETFLDFREDVRDAAKDGKRVMVYFGQDGCPYCKALMKHTFADAGIVAAMKKDFVAIALNLWGDREVTWLDGRAMPEKELGRVLQVQYTPTLLFLDESGKVVLRLNGYMAPDKFRPALAYVSQRLEKKLTYTDYLAQGGKAAAAPAQPPLDLSRGDKRKPVMLLFESNGCRDCEELRREGFTRAEVKPLLARFRLEPVPWNSSRVIVKPDGERTTAREWARDLGLTNVPTAVFLNESGCVVFRIEGYVRPFHLASALDYVASRAYRSEPEFQRFVQKRADAQRAAGKAVDLWK